MFIFFQLVFSELEYNLLYNVNKQQFGFEVIK